MPTKCYACKEQRILHQQHTPQSNLIILPTEVANLPTETDSGRGVSQTTILPLSAESEVVKIKLCKEKFKKYVRHLGVGGCDIEGGI